MPSNSPGQKLISAVTSVDWGNNISSFSSKTDLVERVGQTNYRIAVWAKQLEIADSNNPALTFFREVQVQGHYVATLISLSLYKPAGSAMRAMFECALYYSYFRNHPAELSTLIREPKYYVSKTTILNYHKKHTVGFSGKQEELGLLTKIEAWYSVLSSLVHGQIPGKWVTHLKLSEISFKNSVCKDVVSTFEESEQLVHWLLLCTINKKLWYKFNRSAKVKLLKGLSQDVKQVLELAPS